MSNEIAEPEVITVQSGAAGSREISLSRWPTERKKEGERENEGRRRGWTEQGTTRKSFNTVYRRRVKERNVSESFGPRKFVTRSTCKNILGDATADLHFHRLVSIARLIFLRREILHPLAPLIELEPSMSRLTG